MLRRKIIFFIKLLFYWMYHISKLFPRDKHKWLFGSHVGFSGNTKFMMIEILDSNKEIRPIWISHNRAEVLKLRRLKFESYYWLSLMGIYHCLTSGVYLCTESTRDINCYTSGNALFVNLWHGVGLKKMWWLVPDKLSKMFGVPENRLHDSFYFKVYTFPYFFRTPDICLVTSEYQAKTFFSPMMNIPISNCVYGNYPRNELFRKDKNEVMAIAERYEPKETIELIKKAMSYRKVYVYMPTWRNDGNDFIKASKVDFKQLNKILCSRESLLILKFHPRTRIDMTQLKGLSNVIEFNSLSDIYYVLPFTDCLITDYSSIYSDYLLMGKEIILFPFDIDSFKKNSADLKEYNQYYPGERAYSFDDLVDIIGNNKDCHVNSEDYNFVMNNYWGNIDDGIGLVNVIKKKLLN